MSFFRAYLLLAVFIPVNALSQTSNLVSMISNAGTYGPGLSLIDSLPAMEYPAGSGVNYLFDGQYWVSGKLNGEIYVSSMFIYGGQSFTNRKQWQPAASEGSTAEIEFVLLGVDRFEYSTEYFSTWELIDGFMPIGLRVFQRVEAFPTGSGPDQAFLLQQALYNETGSGLDSVYIGWMFDFDIAFGPNGDPSSPHIDDWVSYQSERLMGYMWDGDNPYEEGDDTGDFGLSPGYAGIALLDTPLPLASYQWWGWDDVPSTAEDDFQYMAGIHPASGGEPFRADPDTVFEYRALISTGPYSMAAGDSIRTAVTFAIGDGLEGLNQAVDEMIAYYQLDAGRDAWNGMPLTFRLDAPYPNPFNASILVPFTLDHARQIELAVFNTLGQRVATLVDGTISGGSHNIPFNAGNLSSGIYWITLKTGGRHITRSVTVLK